jgi:hypothetical protein
LLSNLPRGIQHGIQWQTSLPVHHRLRFVSRGNDRTR